MEEKRKLSSSEQQTSATAASTTSTSSTTCTTTTGVNANDGAAVRVSEEAFEDKSSNCVDSLQKEKRVKTDEQSNKAVLNQFRKYAQVLTDQQDQRERLVKLSRDTTIASKRIIFLLQRFNGTNRDSILNDALEKLKAVHKTIKAIAKELTGCDPAQYHSAYSPGMQEYIEAATFFKFIEDGTLPSIFDLEQFIFADDQVRFTINSTDYILGIGDLTGEMMRLCINNAMNESVPQEVCNRMREIYQGRSPQAL
eukprot:gene527-3851_t